MAWLVAINLVGLRPERPVEEHRAVGELLPWLLGSWVLVTAGAACMTRTGVILTGRLTSLANGLAGVGVAGTALSALAMGFGSIDALAAFALSYFAFAAGTALFGVQLLRGRVVPAAAAWLVIVAGPLLLLFNTDDLRLYVGLPFAAGWTWVGYAVGWRR